MIGVSLSSVSFRFRALWKGNSVNVHAVQVWRGQFLQCNFLLYFRDIQAFKHET